MEAIDLDAHWSEIRLRAKEIVAREPALGTLLNETVVERDSFAECLTYRLTRKLVNHSASIDVLHETFMDAFVQQPTILQHLGRLDLARSPRSCHRQCVAG